MEASLETIVTKIDQGIATEGEVGLALRAIQTQMSFKMIQSLDVFDSNMTQLNTLLSACVNRFNERLTMSLEADTVDMGVLFEYITTIQNKQLQYAELYRKIVQSPKSLFSEDLLSEDEKKVIQLFKSFRTVEERRKFLELCDKALSEQESFE